METRLRKETVLIIKLILDKYSKVWYNICTK